MARKIFFKNESERMLWIRLNAERIQYSQKMLNGTNESIGKINEPFSIMQTSLNQLGYDEMKRNAPRFSFEELVLPHAELFKLAEKRNKQKITEMFGTELGKIVDEIL